MHIIWRDTADASTYEAARLEHVFNMRHPARFPLAIVKATCENDIIAAVKLAIQHKCQVTVRSGGHSLPVWSLQDESILVDLGDWKELEVDADKQMARASPSVTSKGLNDELAVHGLVFPGGHCPDVGLGGFLLQGGMGWNCGNWGWACERVDAVDVVTAQGELVHCDAHRNADLYWAARGAGPAFPGLVTRFYLNLIPYPKDLRSSGYIYPRSRYRDAFNWALNPIPTLDKDTEVAANAKYRNGEIVFCLYFTSYKDTHKDAATALQPIQDTRPPGALDEWFCQKDSLSNLYAVKGKENPRNHRYCTDNAFLQNHADLPSILEEALFTMPHPQCYAFWALTYPWSRQDLPNMALSLQSDHYFAIYTIWEDEADDQRCKAWLQGVMEDIKDHSIGAYIGESDFQLRRARYWADENTQRLMDIRRKWDPEGRVCGGYPDSNVI